MEAMNTTSFHSVFFPLDSGSCHYSGRPDAAVRWIAEKQLKNRDAWRHFIDAFRTGIDSTNRGWRGEYWGKMMRGACLAQAYLRDPELGEVLREAVVGLLDSQDEQGRISSYRADAEFAGWDVWGRKYVLTGLQHYHDICDDEALRGRILVAMRRHADYIVAHIGPDEGQTSVFATSQNWGGVNSCSILEPFVRLYGMTGEGRYLDFARYLVECGGCDAGSLVDLAREGRLMPADYPEAKAYETISYFEGLLAYAETTGDEKLFDTVVAFADAVSKTDITVIGCAGCTHELFDHSADKQTEYSEIIMQETCVTVTWMRFCARLLEATGEPRWADEIERSAWNALYGAINDHGVEVWSNEAKGWMAGLPVDSYSPLYNNRRGRALGGYQRYPDGFVYGCCVCIFAAGIALVPRTAVLGLSPSVSFVPCDGYAVVGLFRGTVSVTTPRAQPLLLEIEGDYPLKGECRIRLSLAQPEFFRMVVRVPGFARGATLSACGETHPVDTGFTVIDREWRNGDTMELTFDMPLETMERNGRVAFRRGPIVLARDARKENALARATGGEGGSADLTAPLALAPDAPAAAKELPPDPAEGEMLRLSLPRADGSALLLTDYASCGKHWRDPDGVMSAWLNP